MAVESRPLDPLEVLLSSETDLADLADLAGLQSLRSRVAACAGSWASRLLGDDRERRWDCSELDTNLRRDLGLMAKRYYFVPLWAGYSRRP